MVLCMFSVGFADPDRDEAASQSKTQSMSFCPKTKQEVKYPIRIVNISFLCFIIWSAMF